jgi:O-antigen biosynthesis protein
MKLSVVIVNYNVKHFLEQCLHSVAKASANLDCEVFVVDNNSVDGSVTMVKEKFPRVRIIHNNQNVGFSKANNQAIRQSKGEYVLLLNPDTLVEDDTFLKVVSFMDQHPDAGGLGVKMVDGKGNFLPESKRGLPTPEVAFYKIFGLSKMFPKSRTFGRYHLTYLDKDEIHQVDILSGAFMLLRKSALDRTGLLDETFFMYGEDVDLSYRIIKAGYKNYYFPQTRIIHYKGESTKKSSINYVLVFYNAMVIFAQKHFSHKNARLFSFLINLAIYFRAFLAIVKRFTDRFLLPFTDAVIIYAGIYFIQSYWASSVIFKYGGNYPPEFLFLALPVYILIWLVSVYLSGGYDKPINMYKIFRGLFAGTVSILVFYSLLDESLRYSRALILLGGLWAYMSMTGSRLLLNMMNRKDFKLDTPDNKRYLIVGDKVEAERVAGLLSTIGAQPSFIGLISLNRNHDKSFTGHFDQMKIILEIYKINEIIFCAKSVPSQLIIDKMSELQHAKVEFKIAPPESLSLIGSNSISIAGDVYSMEINSIGKSINQRNKRFLDVSLAIGFLVAYPLLALLVKQPAGLIKNIFQVILGKKTWVGYCKTDLKGDKLPRLKPGAINPANALSMMKPDDETLGRLNLLYARDYKISTDLDIIIKGFRHLGAH